MKCFIGSFKYFQGDSETLFKVSQGYDRYFIVLSESEYQSWQTYGWIRSPRVSDELSSPQDQVFHAIHVFNRIGDAINHLYYLRVAHSFVFNCHSESGHGRYYIYSGTLRGNVQDIPEVSEEARARILRIVIDQESMLFTDEVKFRKIKLHQFFSNHQIWSAQTEMFKLSVDKAAEQPRPLFWFKILYILFCVCNAASAFWDLKISRIVAQLCSSFTFDFPWPKAQNEPNQHIGSRTIHETMWHFDWCKFHVHKATNYQTYCNG